MGSDGNNCKADEEKITKQLAFQPEASGPSFSLSIPDPLVNSGPVWFCCWFSEKNFSRSETETEKCIHNSSRGMPKKSTENEKISTTFGNPVAGFCNCTLGWAEQTGWNGVKAVLPTNNLNAKYYRYGPQIYILQASPRGIHLN